MVLGREGNESTAGLTGTTSLSQFHDRMGDPHLGDRKHQVPTISRHSDLTYQQVLELAFSVKRDEWGNIRSCEACTQKNGTIRQSDTWHTG